MVWTQKVEYKIWTHLKQPEYFEMSKMKNVQMLWMVNNEHILKEKAIVALIVWQLDLQLPMQSVPITTDVVSSNLDQGEVYNISLGPPVSSTN